LREDGLLDQRPVPELELLRGRHYTLQDIDLRAGIPIRLRDINGDTLELMVEFEPGAAVAVGLTVRCSLDGQELTRIFYDCVNRHLVLDAAQSSLSDTAHRGRHAGPLPLADGETIRLRIFLDGSLVEVFANERVCVTGRIYPVRADSLGLALWAHGGPARLRSLDIWEMGGIWEDRR
jgi:beta-fructofuranosidase